MSIAKNTVFIIHGIYGNPEENWFPWLKKELELLGCEVHIPQFPTPKNQSLESWRETFNGYRECLPSSPQSPLGDCGGTTQDTILIGHSLACAFILDIMEHLNQPIKAAFLGIAPK